MKYIRLFENLSDKVEIGDYVYYHQGSTPPFIFQIVDTNPKIIISAVTNGIYYTYSEEKTNYVSVNLKCYQKNGEWKLCKDISRDTLKDINKESFNKNGRTLTPEEIQDIEYLISAGEYNL